MGINIETTVNKIEYFKDLWNNLIDNFLDKSFGLNLYNPHTLVEDIITEIEENSFKNLDNRKYFYDKLNEYFNSDLIIKKYYFAEFKLLRSNFNSNKVNLLLEISKSIQKEFRSGGYFNQNLKLLSEIVMDQSTLNEEIANKINFFTQNIIIEFLKKGYLLDEIKKFVSKIFSDYYIHSYDDEDIIISEFPHEINYDDFTDNGILNRKKLNEKIIKTFDSLTIDKRINKLSYYYYKSSIEAYYIFVVEGLKGTIELNFNEVIFYSSKYKRFATDDKLNDEDLQGEKQDKYIQACVKVDYISDKSSLKDAILKLENTINLLHCYYNTKVKIEVNFSKYIVIQDGAIISRSWSRDSKDNFKRYHDSLNINRYMKGLNEVSDLSYLDSDFGNNQITSKFLTAIRWYSKAEHNSTQEDKLLNYWIALETLFSSDFDNLKDQFFDKSISKIKLIQLVIGSKQVFNFIYDYGWELYHYYSHKIRNQQLNLQECFLPKELIDKANLDTKEGDTIHLKKFINSLEEIKKFETNIFLINKITDLLGFYENNGYTIKKIHEHIKEIENDILRIYRFRNLIVHNAHFDNSLLPYYVWKLKEYSGNLIRSLIYKYGEDRNVNLATHLLNFYIEKETFIINLENNKADLFKDD